METGEWGVEMPGRVGLAINEPHWGSLPLSAPGP